MTGDTKEERGIEEINRIPLHGFINDVAVGPKARFCVVAVGQEPRLGRWDRVSRAKNRFGIVRLRRDESDGFSEEDTSGKGPKIVVDEESDSSSATSSKEETSE